MGDSDGDDGDDGGGDCYADYGVVRIKIWKKNGNGNGNVAGYDKH